MSKLGKIAIIGSGAVGIYYGARLATAGEDVTFLLRSDFDDVARDGFRIESVHGDFQLPRPQIAKSVTEIGKVDLVIIALKATANHLYEQIVTPLLGKETKILTLQNGLGNVELLAELFGKERVFGGLCYVCINRIAPGHVVHQASGMIRLGSFITSEDGQKYSEQLGEVFRDSNIRCEAVPCLEEALWQKLVWNIPFNGLSIADGGVDTKYLLDELHREPIIRELMAEVAAIAKALGYVIEQDFIESQVTVTKNMGAYKPSSMIDFVEGREVEVDALFREPLRCALELAVSVPRLKELVARIEERLSSN